MTRRARCSAVHVALLVMLAACGEPTMPLGGVATLDDAGSDGFVAVSAGRAHTCALAAGGAAYCWGSNEFGQLGAPDDGTSCPREDRAIPCRPLPVAVSGGLTFVKIAAGGAHTCGLTPDQRIFCWGDNLRGALGDPDVRQSTSPVAVVTSIAFVDVTAGGAHTCGLRGDGVAFCWGANDIGQLGTANTSTGVGSPSGVFTAQRFVSIVAGDRRTCARNAENATYCWGAMWIDRQGGREILRSQPQPFRVAQALAFQSLAVGVNTTCAVTTSLRAYCWEANPTGSIGDGTTTGSIAPVLVASPVPIIAVTSGGRHSCGLADSGHAWCWGAAGRGQLGVSPSLLSTTCGQTAPQVCSRVPIRVSGWRAYSSVSAGLGDHTCALTVAGNVYCWGAGDMGQRGDGRKSAAWSPVKVRLPGT